MSEHVPGVVPPLASVHNEVLRDWTAVTRKETNEAIYTAVRESYVVTIEEAVTSE